MKVLETKGDRFKSKVSKLTVKEKADYLTNNPMVESDFEVNIVKKVMRGVFKVDGGDRLPVVMDVESDNSVKIYTKSEYRLSVACLGNSAQKLYLHILYELEYGEDFIEVNYFRFMKENNIESVNTYKTAIRQLCRYLFVCPTLVKGVYWINPKLFFAGNRVKKYPKNVNIL